MAGAVCMRIAIMQPYFFPYLGYFQLISAVDLFLALYGGSFIKKGWIHRNRLCFNGKTQWFTVPLQDASQFRAINETRVCSQEFPRWKHKFLASLAAFYKKQPFFADGMNLVEEALSQPGESIAELAVASLRVCCRLLDIATPLRIASETGGDPGLRREARLIELCRRHNADVYLNPPGGEALYTRDMFAPQGIRLEFLHPVLACYPVKGRDWIAGLSVLDAVMCCGPQHVRKNLLCGYDIVEAA